ncbi:hypothetical protein M5K25_025729 [Dendrobium thyrsiflorum]|uniref:Uncharacterized protein n=1 Tax=Dendrobium thyrsiflorum TaxID=117978 RepID=A0ABD0U9U6_DENTH
MGAPLGDLKEEEEVFELSVTHRSRRHRDSPKGGGFAAMNTQEVRAKLPWHEWHARAGATRELSAWSEELVARGLSSWSEERVVRGLEQEEGRADSGSDGGCRAGVRSLGAGREQKQAVRPRRADGRELCTRPVRRGVGGVECTVVRVSRAWSGSLRRYGSHAFGFGISEQQRKKKQDQEPRRDKQAPDSGSDGWLMRSRRLDRAQMSGEDRRAGGCLVLERGRAVHEQIRGPEARKNRQFKKHGRAEHGRNNDGCRRTWFRMRGSTSWSRGLVRMVEIDCERDWARLCGFARGISVASKKAQILVNSGPMAFRIDIGEDENKGRFTCCDVQSRLSRCAQQTFGDVGAVSVRRCSRSQRAEGKKPRAQLYLSLKKNKKSHAGALCNQ